MAVAMRFGGNSGTAQSITYISRGGGGGGATSLQLLWENSDPTATFAAQTITIDLSTYGAVFIKTLNDRTSQTPQYHTELVFVGDSSVCYSSNASTTSYTYKRQADATTSGITFGNGYRNTTTGSGYAIPVKVYGIGTGETPVPEDPLNTFSGAIVQFNASKAKPIQSIVGTVVASQDLHGYDAPFAPGAKKNWFPYPFVDTTKTVTGITFTDLGDGQIQINGTNTGTTYATFELQASFSFGSTTASFSASSKKYVYGDETLYMMGLASGIGAVYEGNTGRVYIRVTKGATINNVTVSPMMYKTVDNLTVFAPYANICPITGLTGANIFLEAAYDAGAIPKRTVAFGQTVYGGDYTVAADGSVSIELTDAEIASYAGEALPSTWLSDRDEYAVGTTPTTGAQVVYKLASPTTVTATSITALTTLVGNNAVWADTGDITVTAYGT